MKKFTEGTATASVICDSKYMGSRLVSVEVEFPRPYLAEFNTHRKFSRNSASSRAIPVWKRLIAVLERPYIPKSFGVNKAGMQAEESLSKEDQRAATDNWLIGRDIAVIQAMFLAGWIDQVLKDSKNHEDAEELCCRVVELNKKYSMGRWFSAQDRGLHKQHANRVLEPYAFHTVLVTSSYWRNFFGLRPSANAQPEAQDFGMVIARAMMNSNPEKLSKGQWHLPYIRKEDRDEEKDQLVLARASTGKCARTSYLTHDGIRALEKDVAMATGLQENGHMSPFEHPARPRHYSDPEGSNGNFSEVWTQYRKLLPSEHDFTKLISREELLIGCRGDQAMVDFILSFEE